jgi:hypothetical protein
LGAKTLFNYSDIHIETGTKTLSAGVDSATITFDRVFETIPVVMITPIKNTAGNWAPNLYVEETHKATVLLRSSQPVDHDLIVNYIAIETSSKAFTR